ncbi:MAG: tRNA 4-thiouridine(8) synthase ThiI [Mycoplasmataceae bacterium]|nr:tRNA 4-thiouridine(8) synthase ThiI [Mycoplasmataceae bacterium]
MYDKILIRFGELSLKGKNKMFFINKLVTNIQNICNIKFENIDIQIDRIFIPFSEENLNSLNYVFGISSFSPVIKSKTNLEVWKNIVLNLELNQYSTFKMNCRRKWKNFHMDSLELNNYFGSIILKNFAKLKVDVKNPDIELNIEIHKDYSYIFWKKYIGLGGLPVGSSGKALHLLSGGIDSPVAAFEMMKRGVKLYFLSFISPPHTDEMTIKKIKLIIEELNKYQSKSTLFLFNYTDLMNYIGLVSNQAYKIVLMRRSFYRIATIIANQKNCLAISNGENLGQVASQTMEAMKTIHSQTNLPVFQPLLTKDKLETIKQSEKLNLFNISIIKACETCELFAPNNPATKPTEITASNLEQELDMLLELEKKSIEKNIEKLHFKILK